MTFATGSPGANLHQAAAQLPYLIAPAMHGPSVSCLQDAAEGKKVLEFLMRYLDGSGSSWLGGPVLEAGMGIMRQACAEEHQRYMLYSSLMRHVATPGAPWLAGRRGGRAGGWCARCGWFCCWLVSPESSLGGFGLSLLGLVWLSMLLSHLVRHSTALTPCMLKRAA
jgi:hypothetical protein